MSRGDTATAGSDGGVRRVIGVADFDDRPRPSIRSGIGLTLARLMIPPNLGAVRFMLDTTNGERRPNIAPGGPSGGSGRAGGGLIL